MNLRAKEILLPARRTFILLSIAAALFLNLLPYPHWILAIKPDFAALVVLYWCIHQPRKVGFTTAFVAGILMDVIDGVLLGQHALAYSVLAYAGIVLHKRIQMLSMRDQIYHVIALILINDIIVLAIRMTAGAGFPSVWYFIGAPLSGLLWPPLIYLLTLPQRPKIDPDYV